MKYVLSIIAICFGIALAGCSALSSKPPVKAAPGSYADGISARPASSKRDLVPSVTAPLGDLTIEKARNLALAGSPSLAAFGWEVRRSEAIEKQAGIWNNPELELEWMDVDGPDGSALETEFVLSQKFPLGRDIARRRELASARKELINWDYETARLEILMKVSKNFAIALAADRKLDLASREHELILETAGTIRQLVDAGKVSPVELMRIEVPLADAELKLQQNKRLRDAAYRQLSLVWGTGQPTFETVVGDIDSVLPPPNPDILVNFINSNPDVARWSSMIAEQTALRRLAFSRAIPDPTVRVGLMDRDDPAEEALIVGVALPLPIFDRNQGEILAARQGGKASRARKMEAELRVEALLNNAYTGMANAYDEVIVLQQRAIPAAEEGFVAVKTAFTEGKLPLLDVLDAQRTLFALESRYLDALVTYHLQLQEIEALTGTSLQQLLSRQ